jgi:hypothetical protein
MPEPRAPGVVVDSALQSTSGDSAGTALTGPRRRRERRAWCFSRPRSGESTWLRTASRSGSI